jgi:hypothetical protein
MIVPQPDDVRFDGADAGYCHRRRADSSGKDGREECNESPFFRPRDFASVCYQQVRAYLHQSTLELLFPVRSHHMNINLEPEYLVSAPVPIYIGSPTVSVARRAARQWITLTYAHDRCLFLSFPRAK